MECRRGGSWEAFPVHTAPGSEFEAKQADKPDSVRDARALRSARA